MPLEHLLENKLTFYGPPFNLSDETIDNWSFWQWQMNIEKVNKRNSDKKGESTITEDKMKNLLNLNKK
jgi:hypothetical protein